MSLSRKEIITCPKTGDDLWVEFGAMIAWRVDARHSWNFCVEAPLPMQTRVVPPGPQLDYTVIEDVVGENLIGIDWTPPWWHWRRWCWW